ncbi:hypothetical protein Tco_1064841 [Tanacetum coccineum]
MDEDKETTELQSMMIVIPNEEEERVDAIPLATKPPIIVDWKIIKEGKIGYFQIIKADRSSQKKDIRECYGGRIIGIKRLHDDLGVNTAKLRLLVYKLLLLVFRVNAAATKLQLLTELQMLKDYNC